MPSARTLVRVLAVALPVIAAQVALLRFARHLCDLHSVYWEHPNFHVGKSWWMPHCETTFLGYPIAWHEERQIVTGPVLSGGEMDEVLSRLEPERGPVVPVGSNWMIPFQMHLAAIALPPLLAWRFIWLIRLIRSRPRIAKPRWAKLLTVLVLSSGVGLFVALLDVLSTPSHEYEYTNGFGAIPFDHEPGEQLWVVPEPVQWGEWTLQPLRQLPKWVQWLRKQRSEWLPVEPEEEHRRFTNPDQFEREWHRRTARTEGAALTGLLLGAIIIRPWRRSSCVPPLPRNQPAGTVGSCRD